MFPSLVTGWIDYNLGASITVEDTRLQLVCELHPRKELAAGNLK